MEAEAGEDVERIADAAVSDVLSAVSTAVCVGTATDPEIGTGADTTGATGQFFSGGSGTGSNVSAFAQANSHRKRGPRAG